VSDPSADLERYDAIDAEVVSIARSIRILDSLTWPREQEAVFLAGWRARAPSLPTVAASPRDHRAEIAALEDVMGRCDRAHPMGDHLYKTAWSYATAARMLMAVGTAEFTEHSTRLYGRPDRVYERQGLSAVTSARPILEVTEALQRSDVVLSTSPDIPAEAFAERLRGHLGAFFTKDAVEVVVDPTRALALRADLRSEVAGALSGPEGS